MSHTGFGSDTYVYTMVGGVQKWVNMADTGGGAAAISASVATGVTRTIPTEYDIVVVDRYILYGTGALVLEGDSHLKVL